MGTQDLRWFEQSDADVPGGNDWLHPAEVLRMTAMRFAKRRSDWRLGRWTAKRAIAAYFDGVYSPDEIEIHSGEFGRPEVICAGVPAPVTVSLSHRCGVACCAVVAAGTVGCDLELIEPRTGTFVADYFTADEQALVRGSGIWEHDRLVTLVWSAKESALKALGVGLNEDTRSVELCEVDLATEAGWQPLRVRHSAGQFLGWWRSDAELVRTVVSDPAPETPRLLYQSPAFTQSSLKRTCLIDLPSGVK